MASLSTLSAQQIFLSGKEAMPVVMTDGAGNLVSAKDPALEFSFKLEGEKKWRSVGKKGKKLRPYLANDYQAIVYLDKYRNKLRTSTVLAGVGSASLAATMILFFKDPNNSKPYVITSIIGFSSWIPALFIAKSSNQDINTAVMIYNQNKGYVRNHYQPIKIQPSLGYAASNSSLLAGVSIQFN